MSSDCIRDSATRLQWPAHRSNAIPLRVSPITVDQVTRFRSGHILSLFGGHTGRAYTAMRVSFRHVFFLDTTEHSTVCRCPFIPTKSNSHKRACVAHCTSGLTPATLTSAAAGTAVDPAFYIAPDEKQMCTLELDRVLTRCLFLLRCSCI